MWPAFDHFHPALVDGALSTHPLPPGPNIAPDFLGRRVCRIICKPLLQNGEDAAMKLHIGSRERADGWKTLDINPGPQVDFVGDCKDLSQFPEGSIDIIYASHVLEHLPYARELPHALKEWFRVLKPSGRAMISVPDLETLCRLFLEAPVDANGRFHLMRMMFGGQIDEHDFHCVGLTWEFLSAQLARAGFRRIDKVTSLGVFSDTSMLTFCGTLISLNVIAEKTVSP